MNRLERIRDNLQIALNMGGLKEAAQWTVAELDRLIAAEHASFEEWGAANGYDIGHKSPNGEYLGPASAIAWAAWQARTGLRP